MRTIVLMFENSPVIDLTVGRSSVRQRILALLMSTDGGRLHLREVQRRANTSPGTASRELAKLVAAGLIVREAEGNQVYFRASSTPFASMLRTLLVAIPESPAAPRPRRLPRAGAVGASAVEPQPEPTDPIPGPAVLGGREPDAGPAVDAAAPTPPPSTTEPAPRIVRPRAATPAPAPAPAGRSPLRPPGAAPDPKALVIAGRVAESVRSMYRDAVRGIYLYGARASGPAADADVETIIVLDHVDQYGAELERTSHVYAELSHEFDLVVSRIFVTEDAWNGEPDGTLPQVRSEAVAV
jgi:hypothetical protein